MISSMPSPDAGGKYPVHYTQLWVSGGRRSRLKRGGHAFTTPLTEARGTEEPWWLPSCQLSSSGKRRIATMGRCWYCLCHATKVFWGLGIVLGFFLLIQCEWPAESATPLCESLTYNQALWNRVISITGSQHVPKTWNLSCVLLRSLAKLTLLQHTTSVPAVSHVYLTCNLTHLTWVHPRAAQEVFLVQLWWMMILLPCTG